MRLLLDTNVLVLWIVGNINPTLIGQHRRLREFDGEDLEIVNALALQSEDHISTPHVLAETSNFIGSGLQEMVKGGGTALTDYIGFLNEIHIPAQIIAATPAMMSLGLTDSGVLHLADENTCVISMDFHLCNRLSQKGVQAINPRNFRV